MPESADRRRAMVFKFSTSGVFPHELPSTPTTGIIFLALGLLYVAYVRYATALRSIPGPFLASITRIWIFQKQSTFQRPLIDIDLHKKYGPIVRVSPEEVMVSSPKSFRRIYGMGRRLSRRRGRNKLMQNSGRKQIHQRRMVPRNRC